MRHAISRNRWVFVLAAIATSSLGARELPAQNVPIALASPGVALDSNAEWSRLPSNVSACIRSTPSDLLTRTTAYLHATVVDSGNSALVVQADLMAQEVAETMRTRMGGTSDEVPIGDSVVKPWSVPAVLIATMYADGSATRRAASQSGDTLATSMLLDAFDKVRKNGDGLIVWPDGYAADSLVVRLVLWPTALTRDGTTRMIKATHSQFGVFSILEALESPALPKPNNPAPRYPDSDLAHHVIGSLLLQFVVDSSGFAVPSTMHDIWPKDKPRLTGDLGRYYDDFVEATKSTVVRWKFYPAAVGNCHVQQTVQLPVEYKFPGHSE